MRKILFALTFMITVHIGSSQPSVSPSINSEFCPEINIALQFGFGSNNPSNYSIKNDNTLKGCTIIQNIDPSGRAIVKFTDKKETHEFKLWHSISGSNVGTYTFTKIKTLDGIKPTWVPPLPSWITPWPGYDDALNFPVAWASPCNSSTLIYTGPDLKYKDASGIEYGTLGMNFYEWLAPKGWKINGATSDGIMPIQTSSPSASITADPISLKDVEIKFRGMNNCDPLNLKKSDWYKIWVVRPPLLLLANGQNSLTVNCGEIATKNFSLWNGYTNCLNNTFTWNLGPTPNGWKYNNADAPSSITTSTPNLTLTTAGNLTAPSNVSVSVTHSNGSIYQVTVPLTFNNCAKTYFTVTPNPFNIACNTQTQINFTVNNLRSTTGITGYQWNLGPIPNGWLDQLGNSAPASIVTIDPNLTLIWPASNNMPNNISATVFVNANIYGTYSSQVVYDNCPCIPLPVNPTGLNVTNITSTSALLSWDPQPGVSFYASCFGSNCSIFSTSSNTYTLTGLVPNSNILLYLYAYNCHGVLGSASISFTTLPPSCATPTNVTATNSSSGLSINWTPVTGVSYYSIRVDDLTDPNSNYCCSSAGNPPYLFNNVTGGHTYQAFIQAVCSSGLYSSFSIPSAPVTFCPPPFSPYPYPLYNGIYLYFSNTPPTGALSYNLKYRVWPTTTEYIINNIPTSSPYIFTNGVTGTPYQFALQSNCSTGSVSPYSDWSQTPVTPYRSVQSPKTNLKQTLLDNSTALKLFPIPATKEINVLFVGELQGKADIIILNQFGLIVLNYPIYTFKGNNKYVVDISKFTGGLYILKLKQHNKEYIQKLIIQK